MRISRGGATAKKYYHTESAQLRVMAGVDYVQLQFSMAWGTTGRTDMLLTLSLQEFAAMKAALDEHARNQVAEKVRVETRAEIARQFKGWARLDDIDLERASWPWFLPESAKTS